MKITEVNPNDKNWRHFLRVSHRVYQNFPNWICPLNHDILEVFNPKINPAFTDGEAKSWVLYDDDGQPAGRIAAFIDHGRNRKLSNPIGGIGFFECIPDGTYAHALFETATAYLKAFGVDLIEGPVNFGERDKFWGLLANSFDQMPLYHENYNPPYYLDFWLKEGFMPFEQILTLKGQVSRVQGDRMERIAQRVKSRYRAEVRNF